MRLLKPVVVLAFAAALSASPASAQPASPPSVATVVGDLSDISSWGFAQTVPLGQPITWTNQGQLPHTVTFQGVAWDTGLMQPGAAATLVLDAPGVYRYLCTLHPTMVGAVVVSEDPSVSVPNLAIVEGDLADSTTWGYALSVPVGQSVVWTNPDNQAHTATASDTAWDTAFIQPGQSAPLTFALPGLYSYMCSPHPWMRSFLQVSPAM